MLQGGFEKNKFKKGLELWGLGRAFPELGMLLEPVGIFPGTADHPCGAGPRCLKLIPALPTPGKLPETPLALRGAGDQLWGQQLMGSGLAWESQHCLVTVTQHPQPSWEGEQGW